MALITHKVGNENNSNHLSYMPVSADDSDAHGKPFVSRINSTFTSNMANDSRPPGETNVQEISHRTSECDIRSQIKKDDETENGIQNKDGEKKTQLVHYIVLNKPGIPKATSSTSRTPENHGIRTLCSDNTTLPATLEKLGIHLQSDIAKTASANSKVMLLNQSGECLALTEAQQFVQVPTVRCITTIPVADSKAKNYICLNQNGITDYSSLLRQLAAEQSLRAKSPAANETLDSTKLPGTPFEYKTPNSSNTNRSGNIKRPMNAFMVWARTYRGMLARTMTGASNSDISIKLGQEWNDMPSIEKNKYYFEADRIKNQHRRDYPGWVYRPHTQGKKDVAVTHAVRHNMLWARYRDNVSSNPSTSSATQIDTDLSLEQKHTCATGKPVLYPTTTCVTPMKASSAMVSDGTSASLQNGTPITSQDVNTPGPKNERYYVVPIQPKPHQQTCSIVSHNLGRSEKIAANLPMAKAEISRQHANTYTIANSQKVTKITVPFIEASHGMKFDTHPGASADHKCSEKSLPSDGKKQACTKPLLPASTGNIAEKTQANNSRINHDSRCDSKLENKPKGILKKTSEPKLKPTDSKETCEHMSDERVESQRKTKSVVSIAPRPIKDASQLLKNAKPTKQKHVDQSDVRRSVQGDELWPFPFLPDRQVGEGTSSDRRMLSELDSFDPYDPFSYDYEFDHPESLPSLEIDVKSWYEYLDECEQSNLSVTDQLDTFFSPLEQCQHGPDCKDCHNDFDIIPTPAAYTILNSNGDPENITNVTNTEIPDADEDKSPICPVVSLEPESTVSRDVLFVSDESKFVSSAMEGKFSSDTSSNISDSIGAFQSLIKCASANIETDGPVFENADDKTKVIYFADDSNSTVSSRSEPKNTKPDASDLYIDQNSLQCPLYDELCVGSVEVITSISNEMLSPIKENLKEDEVLVEKSTKILRKTNNKNKLIKINTESCERHNIPLDGQGLSGFYITDKAKNISNTMSSNWTPYSLRSSNKSRSISSGKNILTEKATKQKSHNPECPQKTNKQNVSKSEQKPTSHSQSNFKQGKSKREDARTQPIQPNSSKTCDIPQTSKQKLSKSCVASPKKEKQIDKEPTCLNIKRDVQTGSSGRRMSSATRRNGPKKC